MGLLRQLNGRVGPSLSMDWPVFGGFLMPIKKTTFHVNALDAPGCKLATVISFLSNIPPEEVYDVTIEPHKRDRSLAQNNLSFMWYGQAADQLKDETAEEKRAYCKLHFGIPILREDANYKAKYDLILKPRTYAEKIAMMMYPFDLPVTSLMNVKQFTRYLEDVERHFAQQGVLLTAPDDLIRDAMGK